MMIEMNIEASNYENLDNCETQKKSKTNRSNKRIDEKVDVLIISPNESDEITPLPSKPIRQESLQLFWIGK